MRSRGQLPIPGLDKQYANDDVDDDPSSESSNGSGSEALTSAPSLDLGSLKTNEITLLLRARDGPLSPSDGDLLANLGVGRPRLSQILNHLTRQGWLTPRKDGRRRLFELNKGMDQIMQSIVQTEVG